MAPPALPEGIPESVCLKFESLALELLELGFKRYSADAILHRLRWHHHVELGDAAFKLNDHWTAPLARWFMKRNPNAGKFFEVRERAAA
jgi:hypothetical protein